MDQSMREEFVFSLSPSPCMNGYTYAWKRLYANSPPCACLSCILSRVADYGEDTLKINVQVSSTSVKKIFANTPIQNQTKQKDRKAKQVMIAQIYKV